MDVDCFDKFMVIYLHLYVIKVYDTLIFIFSTSIMIGNQ